MYQLSSIHESQLTPFHRSQFIITMDDLQNTHIFRDPKYSAGRYFSVQMNREFFPKASPETIANLLLTTLQIKFQRGETNFLVVYNDGNENESMDILNGLLHVFGFIAPSRELSPQYKQLSAYAGNWTRLLIEEEEAMSRIGILLKK